jgi:hypothetical protein
MSPMFGVVAVEYGKGSFVTGCRIRKPVAVLIGPSCLPWFQYRQSDIK